MKLNNMFPSLIIYDFCDGFSAHTILSRERFVPYPGGGMLANISNGILCQLRMADLYALCRYIKFIFKSMMAVLLAGSPFEVVNVIVRFFAIKMIYLRTIIRVFNKRHGYQTMNEKFSALSTLTKQHVVIALRGLPLLQDMTKKMPGNSQAIYNKTSYRPNPTSGRNLIAAFKTLNVFPYFITHKTPPILVLDNTTYGKQSQDVFSEVNR